MSWPCHAGIIEPGILLPRAFIGGLAVDIILILMLALGVIAYLGAAGRSSRSSSTTRLSTRSSLTLSESPSRSGSTGKQSILEANDEWLRERWRMADAEKAAGNLQHFPKWYFDEATERQRNRLSDEGVSIGRSAAKGQHSDVIGLFEEPDSEDVEKLKFFGVTLKGPLLNQTRARHEVAKLHADPEKQRADPYEVAEKLLEIKPALARAGTTYAIDPCRR